MRTRLALMAVMAIGTVTWVTTPAVAATVTVSSPALAEVGETVDATVIISESTQLVIVWDLDWGDGTEEVHFGTAGTFVKSHIYEQPGTYTITADAEGVTASATITIDTYDGTFADDDGNTFEADVEWLAAAGITRGCNPPTNTLFCPNEVVTRGQMAAFLVRALGYTDPGSGSFADTAGHTFEIDIQKLATAGVTKGCNPPTNDKFCPEDLVTRGQMAAFLTRAFSYEDTGTAAFADTAGSVFEEDIKKLATAGVTKGCNPPNNDMYCPTSGVTRGQMAAFLHRAMAGT